jgi:hypothetical protein
LFPWVLRLRPQNLALELVLLLISEPLLQILELHMEQAMLDGSKAKFIAKPHRNRVRCHGGKQLDPCKGDKLNSSVCDMTKVVVEQQQKAQEMIQDTWQIRTA